MPFPGGCGKESTGGKFYSLQGYILLGSSFPFQKSVSALFPPIPLPSGMNGMINTKMLMEWIRGKQDLFLLLIHLHMFWRVLWAFWSLWRFQKPGEMVSSNTSTTTALLRIGPDLGSSFGLGISFPAFFWCFLYLTSCVRGSRLPRILVLLLPAWKQLEVWVFEGSFSVIPSAPCSPLLAVKAQTLPTKNHWMVLSLEELVNLVAALSVVLERGPFPPLCWFTTPLLWPLELLPVTALLVRAFRVLPFLMVLLSVACWVLCTVFNFFSVLGCC